jgi:prepilin signal peptidase PulO-like enzyme (type II secretory pathway)
MQVLLPIVYGAALGAVLAVPARLLSELLLKRRGFEAQMERKHFYILLAAMALIGGVIGWRAGVSFRGLYLLLVLWVSACAFYIDAKHRIIPNELWLAVLVFAVAFGVPGAIRFQIWQSLLGLAVCFVIFFIPSLFGHKIGAGDVKLASAMGFALGLTGSLYAIACMGGMVLVYAVLDQSMPLPQRLKSMIPMGPFLALALVTMSIILV